MAKGIRQPDGSYCYSGPTCKRHGAHNKTVQQSTAAADVKKMLIKSVQPSPLVPVTTDVLDFASTQYTADRYCPGCYGCETGDDYCRGSVVENVAMDFTDAESFLVDYYRCDSQQIPGELVEIVNQSGILDDANWVFDVSAGYYGEELNGPFFNGNQAAVQKINQYYWALPNANDHAGVLTFLRSKGMETQGKTPAEAVQEYLGDNASARKLMRGRKVTGVGSLTLDKTSSRWQKITFADKAKFDKTRPAPKLSDKTPSGILLQDMKNYTGNRVLVDGYAAMKAVKSNVEGKARFITVTI